MRKLAKHFSAAVLLIALVLTTACPRSAFAWGPDREVFTMEEPAPYITFNSIVDNPNYGDERNFFRVRPSNRGLWDEANVNGWRDVVSLKEGEVYEARVYVENSASDNLNLVAENSRVMMNMPIGEYTYGRQFQVNAFISSSNSSPNEIWDNIVLKADEEFHVEIISARYYNNVSTQEDGGFDLGDGLFKSGGSLIGYEEMDGRIKGTYQESGYVLVKFRPVFKNPVLRFFKSALLDKLLSVWELQAEFSEATN